MFDLTPLYDRIEQGRSAALIIPGDCVEVMQALPEESIDSCVTDPPYGLGFMGKGWDTFGEGGVPAGVTSGATGVDFKAGATGKAHSHGLDPSRGGEFQTWCGAWAREALRVLKPGGFLLAFGGTRTYHRMACAIEDAGFEIRDCIMWIYGSGFPKSLDVSKALEKQKITSSEEIEKWQGWGTALKPAYEPIIVARKPLIGTVAENVLAHGTGAINVDACRIEGQKRHPGNYVNPDGGSGSSITLGTRDRSTFDASTGRWPANVILDDWQDPVLRLRHDLTPEVERIIRLGFGEVPSVQEEHSDVSQQSRAQKILQPKVLCRVAVGQAQREESSDVRKAPQQEVIGSDAADQAATRPRASGAAKCSMEGRKVLVSGLLARSGSGPGIRSRAQIEDGEKAGETTAPRRGDPPSEWSENRQQASEPGAIGQRNAQAQAHSHSVGASEVEDGERELEACASSIPKGWLSYFVATGRYVRQGAGAALDAQSGDLKGRGNKTAKDNGSDYDASSYQFGGLDCANPPHNQNGGASRFFYSTGDRFRYCAKASKADRGEGNTHPTVKPQALMRYLCRLVTPVGGIVLDPFLGSGTTLRAAVTEGFAAVGIEREPAYLSIAQDRVKDAIEQRKIAKEKAKAIEG